MKRVALLVVAVCAAGCAEPKSVLLERPHSPSADAAVTTLWASDIQRIARDGDWLLTRGYYVSSDVIATLTSGEDVSHASIYDAKRGTIIEAVGSGVREITLEELLRRNHHVIVVRPSGMTDAQRTRSVERARSRLGHEFDHRGLLGLNDRDRVYCSELVWWASQGTQRTGYDPLVITPAELVDLGEVVYWSGHRTDPQIIELATTRRPRPRTVAARN